MSVDFEVRAGAAGGDPHRLDAPRVLGEAGWRVEVNGDLPQIVANVGGATA